ncbi:unnamed protein product [Caenorhabditis nigoni]
MLDKSEHNRLTGYGSGSTAVVKCHVITDGFPDFTIRTANGRTLVGNDAELWEYRTVIDEFHIALARSTATDGAIGRYQCEEIRSP